MKIMKQQVFPVLVTVALSAHCYAANVDMDYVASLFGDKDITPSLLSTGTLQVNKAKTVPDKKPNTKNQGECDFSQNECDNDGECAPGLLCTDGRKGEFKKMGFGDLFQRRVYCIPKLAAYKTEWNWEVCYDPKKLERYLAPQPKTVPAAAPVPVPVVVPVTVPVPVAVAAPVAKPAAVMGDPHFITYEGTKYSYHGECDLVLAHNPTFDSGLGLAIHVRSELVTTWSLISNAAVRIGDDTFEVVNDGSHFFNGIENAEFPLYMAGKYEINKSEVNGRPTFTIDMNNSESIVIFINMRMIAVRSSTSIGSVGGMTGVVGHDGVIGRDGVSTITDVNAMGAEWQVRDDDAMIFQSARAPQYPQQCKLPSVSSATRRMLRNDEALMTIAMNACVNVIEELKDFCIEDVLQTKDPLSAKSYLSGIAF